MLATYQSFAPTPFDPAGSFLSERQDWLVAPCSITRDSGILELSNWRSMLHAMDPSDDSPDVEVHRFGHWGPGWYEIAIVRPGTGAHDIALEISSSLEDYPILCEDDYSEREWESACESWEATDTGDRIKILARHGLSIFAARRDSIPDGLPYYDDFHDIL